MSFITFGFGHFLEEDENILKVFRKIFLFVWLRMIFQLILWGGIAFLVWYFYPAYGKINLDILWQAFAFFALYKTLGPFFYWYYNGIVMTNEGILLVYWKSLFHRSFVRIDFHNLDEIEGERKGLWSFFLNYGTLRFQKTNGGMTSEMNQINAPSWVSRKIESHREKAIHEKNFSEDSALKQLLSQMVNREYQEAPVEPDPHNPWAKVQALEKQYRGPEFEGASRVLEPEWEEGNAKKEKPKGFFGKSKRRKVSETDENILVEKELDDRGGISLDL